MGVGGDLRWVNWEGQEGEGGGEPPGVGKKAGKDGGLEGWAEVRVVDVDADAEAAEGGVC